MLYKKLASIRKEKGFTQEALARKANISYHTVIKLENGGIKNPKAETIVKLADALDISTDRLLRGKKREV